MFNPFVWLDGVQLNAAQKFCNKFERLTGLTKFRLEKWALILSVVFLWAGIIISSNPSGAFLGLAETFIVVQLVRQAERNERTFLEDGKARLPIWHDAILRISAVFFLLVHVMISVLLLPMELALSISLCLSCLAAAVYFEACIPWPPSKSTMREWYERALTALNESLKPEPALVPILVGK